MSAPKVCLIALLGMALSATAATAKECPPERLILTSSAGDTFVAQAYGYYESAPHGPEGMEPRTSEQFVIKGKLNGQTAYLTQNTLPWAFPAIDWPYLEKTTVRLKKKIRWTGKRREFSLIEYDLEHLMSDKGDDWKITGCRK